MMAGAAIYVVGLAVMAAAGGALALIVSAAPCRRVHRRLGMCWLGHALSASEGWQVAPRISVSLARPSGLFHCGRGRDIFGDGVNVAARPGGLAEPGGICVSARVQEDAVGKLDLAFENLAEQVLKNIARRIRAYRGSNRSRICYSRHKPDTGFWQ
jgi:hypothetical protein